MFIVDSDFKSDRCHLISSNIGNTLAYLLYFDTADIIFHNKNWFKNLGICNKSTRFI